MVVRWIKAETAAPSHHAGVRVLGEKNPATARARRVAPTMNRTPMYGSSCRCMGVR
jgi:hypothetical protein